MTSIGAYVLHDHFYCCIFISIYIYHSFLHDVLLGPLSMTMLRPSSTRCLCHFLRETLYIFLDWECRHGGAHWGPHEDQGSPTNLPPHSRIHHKGLYIIFLIFLSILKDSRCLFHLLFDEFLLCMLERAIHNPMPSQRFKRALIFANVLKNLQMPRISTSFLDVLVWNKRFAFWCCRRFCHCLPLHSMPYCGAWIRHWHLQGLPPSHTESWAGAHFSAGCPTMGSSILLLLQRWQNAIWICCVRLLLDTQYVCLYFSSPFLVHFPQFFFFYILCVQSSIGKLDLHPHYRYVCNLFDGIQVPFVCCWACPSPNCIFPFNRFVLDFLDVELKQGKESERDDSPRRWLSLVGLDNGKTNQYWKMQNGIWGGPKGVVECEEL